MKQNKRFPERLCIACREKKYKKNLIRIVKNKNGEIFVDLSKKANGRGAYICLNEKCIKDIQKKKILQKKFKCVISQDIYFELDRALN